MLDVDVLPLVARGDPLAHLVAAVTVARHVAAHPHFGARRRLQEEMRIETGDRLEAEQWNGETLCEGVQLSFRQIAVSPLNPAEFVEDW